MVEVASYKTPKMIQQITYKDKAAPPTDWSQFVMDPLVLQQFYGVVASKCSGQATQLAFISGLSWICLLFYTPQNTASSGSSQISKTRSLFYQKAMALLGTFL